MKHPKPIPAELTCNDCQTTAPLEAFAVDRRARIGRKRICKPCAAARTADYARRRPETQRANYTYKREKMCAYRRTERARHRTIILDAYGGRCACCGESEPKFLALDHVNNDGNAQRRKLKLFGDNFYRWIIKNSFPATLQLLCHNCNMAKGFYGRCPHLDSRS